jgi:hypothetical protein
MKNSRRVGVRNPAAFVLFAPVGFTVEAACVLDTRGCKRPSPQATSAGVPAAAAPRTKVNLSTELR